MAKDIEIGVKVNGLAAVRSELKALKGELINATDPKEIERLSKAAGQLSDKIADANEKIKVFAGGSEFEKVSNGLGLVGQQLSSLDFAGASESAKLLTNTIKGMDPKAVAQGFKDFTATIGQLGNAFFQMGLKLLANPIFLLIAVVTAIVVAIILLKDKVKILGEAFDILMIPIKLVIQGLKDLTDWLGITSFADDEATAKFVENSKKKTKANQDYVNDRVAQIDREIALEKAKGKNIEELELKKQAIIAQGAAAELRNLRDRNEALKEEEKRAAPERLKEIKKEKEEIVQAKKEQATIYKDANNEFLVIQETYNTEERKAQDDADAKGAEARKKRIAERIALEKKKHEQLLKDADAYFKNAEQAQKDFDARLAEQVTTLEEGLPEDPAVKPSS